LGISDNGACRSCYPVSSVKALDETQSTVAAWRSDNIVGRINEVSTGMGDHLRRINHLSISPSHLGQLSLLPSAGRKMSTSQSAVGDALRLRSKDISLVVHFTCA